MRPGHALIGAGLVVGAADWVAVARGSNKAEYVLKPLATVLFIAAAVALRSGPPFVRWALTVAALVASLGGDVFLMMLKDLFVAGLGSFLVAHGCYVAAFNLTRPPFPLILFAAVGVLVVAAPVFLAIRRGMLRRGHPELVPAVAVYVLALSATVASAIGTAGREGFDAAQSAFAITGALLFYGSDGMIGWTRFVSPLPAQQVLIMVTYHLAQAFLILGLLHR